MSNIAVILAGGIGKRMNTVIPKQFINVNNKPILIYTIEKFENCKDIDDIYVVVHKDWVEHTKELLNIYNINKFREFIIGGSSAQESIYNALKTITSNSKYTKKDVVLFHESVRPLVTEEIIIDTLNVAKNNGTAISCGRPYEYFFVSNDGIKPETCIHRDVLYSGMNPQAANFETCNYLKNIISNMELDIGHSLIDFFIYSKIDIFFSKGDINNFKITRPLDLEIFKSYINQKSR